MVDMNLPQLVEQFQSEDKCRAYLEQLRWPNGLRCLRCEGTTISRITKRHQLECDSCGYQFSVTVGTVFHDTHLPLWKWLLATYLIAESKKGVSASQLKRTLNVSYKTAWYLCHRIREAMKGGNLHTLGGVVEMDETYIGGKRRGVGAGTYRDYKTAVLGAVERGGRIRLKVVPRVNRPTVKKFLNETTQPQAHTIYTDDSKIYSSGIIPKGVEHESVIHSKHEYVRADVHTNTVESVWSLLKRSIVGSYHQLSTKHLPRYLDEMAFKYNNRRNAYLFRDTVLRLLKAETLPYKKLVAPE